MTLSMTKNGFDMSFRIPRADTVEDLLLAFIIDWISIHLIHLRFFFILTITVNDSENGINGSGYEVGNPKKRLSGR